MHKMYENLLHIRCCSSVNKTDTIPALMAMVCVFKGEQNTHK